MGTYAVDIRYQAGGPAMRAGNTRFCYFNISSMIQKISYKYYVISEKCITYILDTDIPYTRTLYISGINIILIVVWVGSW